MIILHKYIIIPPKIGKIWKLVVETWTFLATNAFECTIFFINMLLSGDFLDQMWWWKLARLECLGTVFLMPTAAKSPNRFPHLKFLVMISHWNYIDLRNKQNGLQKGRFLSKRWKTFTPGSLYTTCHCKINFTYQKILMKVHLAVIEWNFLLSSNDKTGDFCKEIFPYDFKIKEFFSQWASTLWVNFRLKKWEN